MRKIMIVSPFSFKTSLEIALEVTFPILSKKGYEEIRDFIMQISNVSPFFMVDITEEVLEHLISCIEAFKSTKTFIWLRDDFSSALLNIEIQCLKQKSIIFCSNIN